MSCFASCRVKARRGDQKAVVAVANKMLNRKEQYESVDGKRYAKKLNSLND